MKRITRNSDLEPLIRLVHHRWNIPIVAELHRQSGAKFVTLANRLGVSRASLCASLDHLITLGLVKRNTGHGHPMRPEYLLTAKGVVIGDGCLSLMRIVIRRDETRMALKKWSLPLVAAIGERRLRFNELRAKLDEATPRALTIGLKSLIRERWAARLLIDDYPPAAGYELKPKGQVILVCVHQLCTIN